MSREEGVSPTSVSERVWNASHCIIITHMYIKSILYLCEFLGQIIITVITSLHNHSEDSLWWANCHSLLVVPSTFRD